MTRGRTREKTDEFRGKRETCFATTRRPRHARRYFDFHLDTTRSATSSETTVLIKAAVVLDGPPLPSPSVSPLSSDIQISNPHFCTPLLARQRHWRQMVRPPPPRKRCPRVAARRVACFPGASLSRERQSRGQRFLPTLTFQALIVARSSILRMEEKLSTTVSLSLDFVTIENERRRSNFSLLS